MSFDDRNQHPESVIKFLGHLFEMLLQEKQTGNLVEILDVQALANPVEETIPGRVQSGQEEQDPESYRKDELIFPSGETLPRCWIDANYRNAKR